MNPRHLHLLVGTAVAALAQAALADGPVAFLSLDPVSGSHSIVAPAGGTVNARVVFEAPVGVEFNAAMFRIVCTKDLWTLDSYDWMAPFVTHGPGDFSLHGLSTPLQVSQGTLQGNGYPIDAADIDFGVFDFFLYADSGPVMDVTFRIPDGIEVGTHMLVAAVPDQISSGFLVIPTSSGRMIDVVVGDPGQSPPLIVLRSATATTCGLSNGAIDVTVSFATSVNWVGPNGFTASTDDIVNLAPGTYSLQAVGPGGIASKVVEIVATPDITAPVISSYTPSATAGASAACTAPAPDLRASVVAADNCTASAALVITQSPAPGQPVAVGTSQITLTATDASGNARSVTALFSVNGTPRTYYTDADLDGFGWFAGAVTVCSDNPPAGKVSNSLDCDDANATINPARPELCDQVDNDCSGIADDGVVYSDFYTDADSDGFGSALASPEHACIPPAGKVTNNADCNDADNLVRPNAIERCGDIGVDNDCDGNAAEVAPNAPDLVSYYRDADGDQYGTAATTVRACEQPVGHVSASGDCNDANAAVNPGATETCNGVDDDCAQGVDNGLTFLDYFVDGDADGYGRSGTSSVRACAPVAGRAPNSLDCNDADAAIRPNAAEVCDGVDNNCDGAVDPGCTALTAYLTPSAPSVRPGGVLRARISGTAPTQALVSARFALQFDATRLRLDSAQPVAGGPFAVETQESIDNTAGTLVYAVAAAAGASGMSAAADIAELSFTVLPAPTACSAPALASFAAVGSVTTTFTTAGGVTVTPSVVALTPVSLDGDAPVLAGVPGSATVPADAGTIAGGTVAAPSVTATDGCDGAVSVSTSIAYPNGTTGTAWPSGGVFPVGTTVVTFSASDAAGNLASASCGITVSNHQLLDATLSYQGVVRGAASRTLRVKVGPSTQLVSFAMANGASAVLGIQVPVAAGYACVSAKDTRFAVTSTASPSVSARRYAASLAIAQGDSDDDDRVDIADFGYFFVDRSTASHPSSPADARSNFNADTLINNADFTYIATNFFRTGDTCTPGAAAPQPRERISVKELRRMGRGELAAADLNRDGWVDLRDIQMFMQGGGASGAPRPEAEQGVQW